MSRPLANNDTLLRLLSNSLIQLPAPANLTSNWNFGSLLGLCLGLQLATGLFVSMHYVSSSALSFDSVLHLCYDVNYGWWLRSLHANGASIFFAFLYCHLGRGLYYQSFWITKTWIVGVSLLFLVIATAFLGYVLPWGQISFWGATVITNLISAIPYIGESIVNWLWGGFAVGSTTLTRFYSLHFLLPFVLAGFVILHLMFLHVSGSSNPLGVSSNLDNIPFHPYYVVNDSLGFSSGFILLLLVCLVQPYLLGDPDNFIPANPLATPLHIKPEWYFLFAYAILRSIPSKLGGVLALVSSIAILYFLPIIHTNRPRSLAFSSMRNSLFWSFSSLCLLLTWIGGNPVEDPYILIGQVCSLLYFTFYLIYY